MEQPERQAKPVWYWLHSLNEADQAYYRTNREFFTVVWAVLLLRLYFAGSLFTMPKNHDSSVMFSMHWGVTRSILNMADVSVKLERWNF